MHEHLFGIVPPMTTPFRADDTIDEHALRVETRYLIETARVHGLAVTGSTGEGHVLSTDEVRRITSIVTEEAHGRVPVITGIITDSTSSAVERGLAVKDLGVAALQVTPVHYLFRPDDDAMVRHFDTPASRTGLRIIIYNVVACQAGDHKQALAIHEKLLPIWNAIFDANLPANVKCCQEMQGRS